MWQYFEMYLQYNVGIQFQMSFADVWSIHFSFDIFIYSAKKKFIHITQSCTVILMQLYYFYRKSKLEHVPLVSTHSTTVSWRTNILRIDANFVMIMLTMMCTIYFAETAEPNFNYKNMNISNHFFFFFGLLFPEWRHWVIKKT